LYLITACATTSDTDQVIESEKISRAPLDGIWKGEFDIRGRGPYDFTVVQLKDKAFAFSLKAKAMCIGTFTFDGEHTLHKYVLFALDGGLMIQERNKFYRILKHLMVETRVL